MPGGKRPGAGRPKLPERFKAKKYSVRLYDWEFNDFQLWLAVYRAQNNGAKFHTPKKNGEIIYFNPFEGK